MIQVDYTINWRNTTPFDSEDDYRTGCQNISHCQQQQSYSGLRSPGRSNSTFFWNDSWVQTFHNLKFFRGYYPLLAFSKPHGMLRLNIIPSSLTLTTRLSLLPLSLTLKYFSQRVFALTMAILNLLVFCYNLLLFKNEKAKLVNPTYIFVISFNRTSYKHHNSHFVIFSLSVFQYQLERKRKKREGNEAKHFFCPILCKWNINSWLIKAVFHLFVLRAIPHRVQSDQSLPFTRTFKISWP